MMIGDKYCRRSGLSIFIFFAMFSLSEISSAEALNCAPLEMNSLAELMSFLRSTDKRKSEFRFVQPRNGQEVVEPRHPQYSNACGFFSISLIVEKMGYARFEQGSTLWNSFHYQPDNVSPIGTLPKEWLNVGYYGSVEHLMTVYVDADTLQNGQNHYRTGFLSADRKDLSRTARACSHYFDPGQEYGLCDPITGTNVDSWMRESGIGCGGGAHSDCSCSPDADCGLFWFLNDELQNMEIAGCNDARGVHHSAIGTKTENKDIRSIIKAFIDNNVPLLSIVNNGGHFMVVIGYTDLDSQGLPQTAIAVDPTFHEESPEQRFWIIPDIDQSSNWAQNERCSLESIYPWNQHLNRGCETGNWARELDNQMNTASFEVCPLESGWTLECVEPHYGINIECRDNGYLKGKWQLHQESPFLAEQRNIDCDSLNVDYADGENRVISAQAKRYQYNSSTGVWQRLSHYIPDTTPRLTWRSQGRGMLSTITWDVTWKDDYWLVAQDLSGTYTKRRTTIELTLDNGKIIFLELAPPQTYGIKITCTRNGTDREYFTEAGAGQFDGTTFVTDLYDKVCDDVELYVNLGRDLTVQSAAVDRWGYLSPTWRQITSTWAPNDTETVYNGLSGTTREFIWDDIWPTNHWFVADNVGSQNAEDRKTRFILNLQGGLSRTLEVTPY